MTTVSSELSPEQLQQAARDHLWLHFTRMGGYGDAEVPIIVRGDGCYLEDSNGKRYLDALAGLFSVNIGYGYGEEVGQAALEQMRELPFYTNWSYAHPRAIELAETVAELAPGDLNRVFFVSGGSEAVESAWKLARQYYLARGEKETRNIVTPGARAGAQEPETMHDAIVGGGTTPTPVQGGRPPSRLPRDDLRGALDQRHRGDPDAVRAARSRSTARRVTRTATTARRTRPRSSSPRTCWTTSSRRSWRWGPSRCAWCTWSRCRTPVERSRRPRATGRVCARSATATTSCSLRTR